MAKPGNYGLSESSRIANDSFLLNCTGLSWKADSHHGLIIHTLVNNVISHVTEAGKGIGMMEDWLIAISSSL